MPPIVWGRLRLARPCLGPLFKRNRSPDSDAGPRDRDKLPCRTLHPRAAGYTVHLFPSCITMTCASALLSTRMPPDAQAQQGANDEGGPLGRDGLEVRCMHGRLVQTAAPEAHADLCRRRAPQQYEAAPEPDSSCSQDQHHPVLQGWAL